MTKLIANERFFYNGHGVEVGEEFQAIAKDVPLLTASLSPRARRAIGAAEDAKPKLKPKEPEPEPVMAKVLVPAGVDELHESPSEKEPPVGKGRGRYDRRDMRARS